MMMETAANRKIEEFLAKLSASVAVARVKEPPDQQPVTTSTCGWSFLPSITKAPLVPDALPHLRFKPPRFDGENAPDWINKIQMYYNHHYTPLDDRLYLTQYLFDPPASDWMEYWVENNKGKGWDDFLLALKQRFDPGLYDYVGQLATLRQTTTVEAYQASFESLLQKASYIGDSTLSSLFIAGLKSPLKQVVLMRWPSMLQETFAIVQKLDQRQPNRTKIQEAINDGKYLGAQPSTEDNIITDSLSQHTLFLSHQPKELSCEPTQFTRSKPDEFDNDRPEHLHTLGRDNNKLYIEGNTKGRVVVHAQRCPDDVYRTIAVHDDGEGISEAPSPAAPSATTAARANQPVDGVGTMILEVDEEILDADDERKLGGNSSCDGGHSDSVAHAVSDPDKVVTSESLILEATTVLCSKEPTSFDASVETHRPRAENINTENFIGEMDDCFIDIKVVTKSFKDQQAVINIEQLLHEVSSLDVVGENKETYFGEVKVPSSEVHGVDDKLIVLEMMNTKVWMFSNEEIFLFTDSERLDYGWILIDSDGYVLSFHIGPKLTSARIAMAVGSKDRIFSPPNVMPHTVDVSRDGVEVARPFTIMERIVHIYSATARNWEKTPIVLRVDLQPA